MPDASSTAKPSATSQTKANNEGQATKVPLPLKRKVTYVLKATSSNNLRIPYAVAVNGAALAEFSTKPKRVSGANGKIVTFVDPGAEVALFLNSDANPAWRKNPVYRVTAGDRDVVVTVSEKAGKHTDSDTPVPTPVKATKNDTTTAVDEYTAPLTGDIWMKVSHKYTPGEVGGLVPAGTGPGVLAAIKSIYAGLASAKLLVTEPAGGEVAARTVTVTFIDSDNPKANITSYNLLTDGLTRVHPGGYAALFSAALDNGVTSLRLTSCWRPLLGSIAHRAGLGLDVDYIENVQMNRQELRIGKAKDTPNVSDEEVEKFKTYEASIATRKKAETDVRAAEAALKKQRKQGEAAAVAAAERVKRAKQALAIARDEEAEAERLWADERDANEPDKVRRYRASLLKCTCVAQLFDPWFMDENARDMALPTPNMQRGATTSNERLHSHHLHVTVHEPSIL